jgi:hypothetical protein
MKSRGVVGKRIIRIEQGRRSRGDNGARDPAIDVSALILEDGTRLEPYTIETEVGDYFHGFRVVPVGRASVVCGVFAVKPEGASK